MTSTLLQKEFICNSHKLNNTIQSVLKRLTEPGSTYTFYLWIFPKNIMLHLNSPLNLSLFPVTPLAILSVLVNSEQLIFFPCLLIYYRDIITWVA